MVNMYLIYLISFSYAIRRLRVNRNKKKEKVPPTVHRHFFADLWPFFVGIRYRDITTYIHMAIHIASYTYS